MRKQPLFFYGWIIVAVSFLSTVLAYGARNSFSVFYVAILDEFGWSRAATAGIFSANTIAYGVAAPFVGALVDRFGPRKIMLIGAIVLASAMVLCSIVNTLWHLYLLFGVAGGIGTSLMGYPANAAVMPHWFVKRRGMVFGIFTSGFGASFLVVPLAQYLIVKLGWRLSFVLLGVFIALVAVPLIGLLSRHKPQDMDLFPDGIHPVHKPRTTRGWTKGSVVVNKEWADTNWTLGRALRTHRFWFMFFASFCIFGLLENLLVVHQVALMRDAGFSRDLIISIVAVLGITMVVGNLSGFLSDRIGREKVFNLGCLVSILGVFAFLLLQRNSYGWMGYLYAVSFGSGMGMLGPVFGVALADMFQGKNFGRINGFTVLGFGLGGIIGPWFGGLVFDITRSYSVALVVGILAACLAITFFSIAAPRKIRRMR